MKAAPSENDMHIWKHPFCHGGGALYNFQAKLFLNSESMKCNSTENDPIPTRKNLKGQFMEGYTAQKYLRKLQEKLGENPTFWENKTIWIQKERFKLCKDGHRDPRIKDILDSVQTHNKTVHALSVRGSENGLCLAFEMKLGLGGPKWPGNGQQQTSVTYSRIRTPFLISTRMDAPKVHWYIGVWWIALPTFFWKAVKRKKTINNRISILDSL